MEGYSYSDSQVFNPNVTYSTMWHGLIHSPLDLNALEEIPGSRMYFTPVHDNYPNHTWSWDVWFEWEYPRNAPITITGQWEPAWELN